MSLATMSLEQKSIHTIRTLAMDAVQKANSGHPGTPMALAPLAYHLYMEVMDYNPTDPHWADRDRFVLSCGHASMLQYAMLHLTGFGLSIDEIKNFRQWGSLTPGHPEVHHTPGVEMTTGPLGAGISTAVGMALAEAHLASVFGSQVDHHTYVICSDGDLMEGVASEAASVAGHLGLGKLICYFDDNKITIDGDTSLSFTEDVGARFEAYGWQVLRVEDGEDLKALRAATAAAQAESGKPTLVMVRTTIGIGAPNKAGKSAAHGAPLGTDEILGAKNAYGWPEDAHFLVPDDVAAHMGGAVDKGKAAQAAWSERFDAWAAANPTEATEWRRRMSGALPKGWDEGLPEFEPGSLATRKSSASVLGALMARLPELVGGSADLAGSNGTKHMSFGEVSRDNPGGRIIHFGVREHAMGSICSGMTLHGGMRPFCATFLVFADYMRPAMRLAALMNQPVIYIMTHDSIGLGEDGPTHQPVEHLASLRAIPNMRVFRPGDAAETRAAWKAAIEHTSGPTVLVLTRQGVPTLDPATYDTTNAARGGYVLADSDEPQAILMATGSELQLALSAREILAGRGIAARVVSMPCQEVFLAQSADYRDSVLPPSIRCRVAVEAALPMSWDRFVGLDGATVGMRSFGASAPASVLFEKFGITAEAVADAVSARV